MLVFGGVDGYKLTSIFTLRFLLVEVALIGVASIMIIELKALETKIMFEMHSP